jgi:hypothetical protein
VARENVAPEQANVRYGRNASQGQGNKSSISFGDDSTPACTHAGRTSNNGNKSSISFGDDSATPSQTPRAIPSNQIFQNDAQPVQTARAIPSNQIFQNDTQAAPQRTNGRRTAGGNSTIVFG